MEPAHAERLDLPPLDGADALLSALLDQDPATRRDRIVALRESDPAQAESLAGMLATLEEFGLLAEPSATAGHPTRIGPFRILAVLGHGGMGTVYLAEQGGLHRRVALKVIHGAMAQSERMRERFRREAIAASRLEHPAICPVYEIGETDGTPWIAMRFVAGTTLARRLEEAAANGAPVARDDAARLIAALADGVHAAHESGLVHRDIKPGNVLLDGDGRPVLVDFGLASFDDEDGARLTRTGDWVGTPHYMAPEQISGRVVDRRCDVYSLGVVLYECLTLRTPFDAVNRESLFRQILRDEPEDPRARNRALDRDTVTVLQTALAKDPEQRYRTAAMFADDLRRLLARQPILARRASVLLRLRRFTQRNPLATAFVAVLTAAVVAFALLLRHNTDLLDRAEANEQALRANEQGVLAPVRGLERAVAAVHRQENVDTISALHHAMQRHHVAAVLPHDGVVWCAQFAPQGDRILTCSEDFTARLWDRAGKQIAVMPHNNMVGWAEWSRDGKRFATACQDGRARVFDRDGRLEHELPHGGRERPGAAMLDVGVAHWVMRACFSPSGEHIATSCSDGKVRVWDVARGSLLRTWSGGDKWVEPLAWSADGSLVVAAETDNDAVLDRGPYHATVWALASAGAEPRLSVPCDVSINTVEFAPDATSLLVSSRDGTVRVLGLPRGEELLTLPHAANVVVAAFSPDGTRILTSCADHVVRLWDLHGHAVKEARFEGLPRAHWLRDGERIVVTHVGPGIAVLDGDLQVQHAFRGHTHMIYWPPDLSPDGHQLASASWDGTAVVWQLHDRDLPRLPAHTAGVVAMLQLPDGRVLSAGDDRALCVSDLATGAIERFQIAPGPCGLSLCADGNRVVVAHTGSHGNAEAWLFDLGRGAFCGHFAVGGLDVAGLVLPGDRLLTVAHMAAELNWPWIRPLDNSPPVTWGLPLRGRGFVMAHSASRGQVAVAGWHRRIHVRDEQGNEPGWWLAHDGNVHALAFDGTGQHLASASQDGTVKVWDLQGWRGSDAVPPPVRTLRGHEGRVHAVAWSPDGRWLASAGSDGTTRIWDLGSDREAAVLRGHASMTTALLFTRDGRFLLTGGIDGVIQAWCTDAARLRQLAVAALDASRPPSPPMPATANHLGKAIVDRDAAATARIARELFERATALQDGDEFECLASRLVPDLPGLEGDLDLALRAAMEAVRLSGGRYWAHLDTLAYVHSVRGELAEAVAAMRRALALVDHPDLRRKLGAYEAAAKASPR